MKHFLSAFTFLEVLVGIASVGIIAGLFVPTTRNLSEREGTHTGQAVITTAYSGNSNISETP